MLFLVLLLASISYRHDVPIEKYLQEARNAPFKHVTKFYEKEDGQRNSRCSAVILDSVHVITAAHCLTKDNDHDHDDVHSHFQNPRALEVAFQNRFYAVDTILVHPEFVLHTKGENGSTHKDIGILKLATEISEIPELKLSREGAVIEEALWLSGKGNSCPGGYLDLCDHYGLHLAAQTRVDSVLERDQNGKPKILHTTFVAPEQFDHCNEGTRRAPLPFEGTPKSGDSGGGVFQNTDNEWKLVGLMGFSMLGKDPEKYIKCGNYGGRHAIYDLAPVYDFIRESISEE